MKKCFSIKSRVLGILVLSLTASTISFASDITSSEKQQSENLDNSSIVSQQSQDYQFSYFTELKSRYSALVLTAMKAAQTSTDQG